MIFIGCSDYPEFSSKAYDISSALYSTCRRENAENLGEISALTKSALENSEITAREAAWIEAIIAQAEAGDWEDAAEEARSILEAQVTGR